MKKKAAVKKAKATEVEPEQKSESMKRLERLQQLNVRFLQPDELRDLMAAARRSDMRLNKIAEHWYKFCQWDMRIW